MKKFEEELKSGPVMIDRYGAADTPVYDEGTLIGYFNDWVSPEDYQAKVDELKSQIEKQQPEIPEVPQFVADWLDRKPLYAINGSIPVEIIEWSKKQTGYADLGMNINYLLKLKVNGYTVAKEKRFQVVLDNTSNDRYKILLLKSGQVGNFAIDYMESWLTEAEIKAIDERYWAFAVPVEEEV